MFDKGTESTREAPLEAMAEAMATVTPEDARDWFAYFVAPLSRLFAPSSFPPVSAQESLSSWAFPSRSREQTSIPTPSALRA